MTPSDLVDDILGDPSKEGMNARQIIDSIRGPFAQGCMPVIPGPDDIDVNAGYRKIYTDGGVIAGIPG